MSICMLDVPYNLVLAFTFESVVTSFISWFQLIAGVVAEFTFYKMIFKKGSLVEVCRRDEGGLLSWSGARIVSTEGCYCEVKYEIFVKSDGKVIVEEVPSEMVRPIQPAMRGAEAFNVGDVIEVYDCHRWKPGKVVTYLPSNFVVVRLIGPCQKRTCHLSCLRPRLYWKDGNWVHASQVINGGWLPLEINNKESASRKVVSIKRLNSKLHQESLNGRNLQFSSIYTNLEKRKANYLLHSDFIEDMMNCEAAAPYKKRAIQKFRCQGAVGVKSYNLFEKVDTFPFPRKIMGKDSRCLALSEDKLNHSTEEAESSVGSNNSRYMPNAIFFLDEKCAYRPIDSSSIDDAETTYECPKRRSVKCFSEKELAAKVHKLELSAYHSALIAFYASGPLNWERETLLSNLRYELHISNDEHLAELRGLHSAETF